MKYLIVGLGNIGDEYAATRHNIGFRVLDAFAEASNLVFEDKRYGFVAQMRLKGHILTLLKPSTYMNLSGNAVRYWLQKENIPIENLLVVVDDLAQIPHSVGIPHRRASEFVDFHGISLFNLTNLPCRPEATNRRTTFRMQNSECTMTKNVQLSTSNFSAFQL